MKIEIYTVPNCTWCSKTEKLLAMANISDYKKYVVGEDVPSDFILEKYPMARGYPVIFIDGEFIDGIIELTKLFIQKGLVSSKKNES